MSSHILIQNFEQSIKHLNFPISKNDLNNCLTEIKAFMKDWEQVTIGQQLSLQWNSSVEHSN